MSIILSDTLVIETDDDGEITMYDTAVDADTTVSTNDPIQG